MIANKNKKYTKYLEYSVANGHFLVKLERFQFDLQKYIEDADDCRMQANADNSSVFHAFCLDLYTKGYLNDDPWIVKLVDIERYFFAFQANLNAKSIEINVSWSIVLGVVFGIGSLSGSLLVQGNSDFLAILSDVSIRCFSFILRSS